MPGADNAESLAQFGLQPRLHDRYRVALKRRVRLLEGPCRLRGDAPQPAVASQELDARRGISQWRSFDPLAAEF